MRILHTSDWHLGRLFHRASLLDEQERALSRIVDLVADEGVELVLIAGDLYDRAVPPADAVELFDRTLLQLHEAGASVVAISGNHDSAVRVGYADRLLERLGVTVRGDVSRTGTPVVFEPADGGRPVVVHPIPYLDPLATAHLARDGSEATPDPTPASDPNPEPAASATLRRRFTHHDAMSWAMTRVRADLAARGDVRSVLVAHTFLTGGNPTASERELTVGMVDQVRLDVFDGIDYVALGHLHQGQAFDNGRVAYSGTPLPYSFSEQHHNKAVRLVDLADDGSIDVRVVPLGVGRPLCTLTGTIESLLADPDLTAAQDAWVRVVLTDRVLPLQAMPRLQQRFPHAVELSHEPARSGDEAPSGRPTTADVRRADPLDLSLRFLDERRGVPSDAAERDLVAAALTAVQRSGER